MVKYAITFNSPVNGIKKGNFGIKMDVKGIVCGKRGKMILCEPRMYDFSLLTCAFTLLNAGLSQQATEERK